MQKRYLFPITIFSVLIAAYALAMIIVMPIMADQNPVLSGLMTHQWVANAHFLGGGIALLLGPWQFLANKNKRHRLMGYGYTLAILLSGVAGLVMAWRAYGGLVAQLGFFSLSVAWLISTAMAIWHIRNKRVAKHKRWIAISFGATFAAVTLRLELPLLMMFGLPFEAAYPIIAWACWVPNIALAAWLTRQPVPYRKVN